MSKPMLPKGWNRRPLGEIAQITSGGTPDRSEPTYWGGHIPWVTTGEIQFNTITDTTEKITDLGLKNSSAKLFPPGTLLMAMYGQGKTRGQVAKLGIEASTNQACAAILLKESQNPDYYFHYLASQYEAIRRLGNEGTQQNLSGGILKELTVPVPPYAEQKRIARLLTTWDRAIEETDRLITNARRQKQALQQQVLTGKKRLSLFRLSGEMQHTPHGLIPCDWEYHRIEIFAEEVVEKLGDNAAHPVLSCTKRSGLVDSLRYFKKQVFSLDTSAYKVVPRDCFVYATNHIEEGSIGYQNLYDFGLVSPMYTVFKTNKKIVDSYLYRLLKTEHYRQIFAAATNASVDRRGSLRWKDFKKLRIPLPSLEEQTAISALLDSADREIELLVRRLDTLRSEKTALMRQLFTGKSRVLPDAATKPMVPV